MNEKHTRRPVHYREGETPMGRTDWARLRAMTEEEIEAGALADPDNPPMTEEELTVGEIVRPADRRKIPISIRMDEAELERFKSKGPRYQTRLNDLMVADSENRVLILDQAVAASYANVKNRSAVLNAILRHRAPGSGSGAPQWRGGAVVETVQRVSTTAKSGWTTGGGEVRLDVGKVRTALNAS